MTCTHKTLRDHSFQRDDRRLWTCSHCQKTATWDLDWGYWGSIECKHCLVAAVDFVWCSEACRVALAEKHGLPADEKRPVKREKKSAPPPAWQRHAIAAGWSPPGKGTP